MDAYTGFAEVYDTFMDNIPYQEWADYLIGILRAFQITDGLVLDLGCGTGTMTEILAESGYDMIGVDYSEEMLEIAREKKECSGKDILYLLQDMREFELYGTVRAVVSVCDSINYITSPEELLDVFRLVNNYLDPEGIFVFDFNTVYKYKDVIGDTTIAENREECSFIWDNFYYEEEKINEYDLTIFVKEGEWYRKFEETHYQRGYTAEEMRSIVEKSGLKYLGCFEAFTKDKPTDRSERIYMIAQECGKKKKEKEKRMDE